MTVLGLLLYYLIKNKNINFCILISILVFFLIFENGVEKRPTRKHFVNYFYYLNNAK